ncbi:hypothetical protein Ciccas_013701, partial [Cichlidogyrus casuarinus]
HLAKLAISAPDEGERVAAIGSWEPSREAINAAIITFVEMESFQVADSSNLAVLWGKAKRPQVNDLLMLGTKKGDLVFMSSGLRLLDHLTSKNWTEPRPQSPRLLLVAKIMNDSINRILLPNDPSLDTAYLIGNQKVLNISPRSFLCASANDNNEFVTLSLHVLVTGSRYIKVKQTLL